MYLFNFIGFELFFCKCVEDVCRFHFFILKSFKLKVILFESNTFHSHTPILNAYFTKTFIKDFHNRPKSVY